MRVMKSSFRKLDLKEEGQKKMKEAKDIPAHQVFALLGFLRLSLVLDGFHFPDFFALDIHVCWR